MSPKTQVSLPEDATHMGEVEDVLFGNRGVVLSELTVRFQARAGTADWHEALAKLNLGVIKEGRTSKTAFFALPERMAKYRPFLTTIVTLDDDMPGVATWDFLWNRAENDSPPELMVKSSQRVGRFPDVLDRLGAVWPLSSPIEARVSAMYIALRDDWLFTLAPARLKRVGAGKRIHEARPTRWIISPPSGCVSKITQHLPPGVEDFALQGEGDYTFQWTPRFLNEADGAIWDGLKIFLKPRRSKPKR